MGYGASPRETVSSAYPAKSLRYYPFPAMPPTCRKALELTPFLVMTPFDAIFFDVGNTLLFRNSERILGPLHAKGIFPTSEQLYAIEQQTKLEFDKSVEKGGDVDRGFWDIYYSHLLEDLQITDDHLSESLVNATRISGN